MRKQAVQPTPASPPRKRRVPVITICALLGAALGAYLVAENRAAGLGIGFVAGAVIGIAIRGAAVGESGNDTTLDRMWDKD